MVVIKAGCAVLSAIICFFSSNFGIFAKQVETVQTLTKVKDDLYLMDYTVDYDVDEMLKSGIDTHIDLIFGGLSNILSGGKNFGCTTFNAITPGGDYTLARNFDYMDSGQILVWTHPSDGYASISSVSMYFFGYSDKFQPEDEASSFLTLLAPYAPLDGINEKGLSIGVLELEKAPVFQVSLRPNLTTTTMIRACLDKAATVDEAIEIFKSHDMRDFLLGNCTYHYQIADASGKTCVIEYINGKINVLYPEKKSTNKVNYMAATNFYLTEGVNDPLGMGQDRYETVMNKLKNTRGQLTAKESMTLLKKTSMRDADLHGYICSTLWSTVYNMTDKTVDLCFNGNYDKVYTFKVNDPLTIY